MSFIDEYNASTLVHPNETIFILGKKFTATEENAKEVNEDIFRTFENLVWITYRSGFPQLPNELVGSYISDTGWGCMVRVGQMLFAQLIRHHYGFK
jgi:cysteine protease ATG4